MHKVLGVIVECLCHILGLMIYNRHCFTYAFAPNFTMWVTLPAACLTVDHMSEAPFFTESHALLDNDLRLSQALLTKLNNPIYCMYISEAIFSCCILFIPG